MENLKVVIMAGGKGTRIREIDDVVPKPMIKILNKPILEWQLDILKNQGCEDFIFIVGYKNEFIKNYFGNGENFGVNIEYIVEDEPLGTAGALYFLKDKIEDDFLLINGDIIFDIDVNRFKKAHLNNDGMATIFTHPNSHPYDSGIIISDDKLVVDWLHKEDERTYYKNRVNAGLHFLSPKLLEKFDRPTKKDLDRDILKPLIKEDKLYCYDSPEYVKDMGTPDRYEMVIKDIKNKKMFNKNLKHKQKAIFLDRDGTINKYVNFLSDIDEFELLPNVEEAIKLINNSDYLAIVITNQPVIARGELSFDGLQEIHNKMETLLGYKGAFLDDIFYCPHHPDKGFDNEIKELKIDCDCRKPKPGMLLQAAEKYNIDLSESYMIGDSDIDIKAGKNAGCHTIQVDENYDLLAAVNKILMDDYE